MMKAINFILLNSVFEGIMGFVFTIVILLLLFVGGSLVISWIFGVSISSRYDRRSAVRPDDLPNLIKGMGRLAVKLKDKSLDEVKIITTILDNKSSTKLEKLKDLNQLKQSGIINNEEFEILKEEIIKN